MQDEEKVNLIIDLENQLTEIKKTEKEIEVNNNILKYLSIKDFSEKMNNNFEIFISSLEHTSSEMNIKNNISYLVNLITDLKQGKYDYKRAWNTEKETFEYYQIKSEHFIEIQNRLNTKQVFLFISDIFIADLEIEIERQKQLLELMNQNDRPEQDLRYFELDINGKYKPIENSISKTNYAKCIEIITEMTGTYAYNNFDFDKFSFDEELKDKIYDTLRSGTINKDSRHKNLNNQLLNELRYICK